MSWFSYRTLTITTVQALFTGTLAMAAAQEAPAAAVTLARLDLTPATAATEPAEPAAAEQTAPAPATLPHISITSGADAASSYMFRGLYQEDRGVVAPAYLDIRIPLYAGTGTLTALRANVGWWNSFHSGPTGAAGRGNPWYEADYYASITATLGRWSPGVIATSLTSPNDAFASVREIGATLDYDDSHHRLALAPRAMVIAEVTGQADGGQALGRYLELGVRPAHGLGSSGPMAFAVALPVKTGVSMRGYYEGAGATTVGFISAAVVPSLTVAGPRVSLELHGGLELLHLGAAPAALNGGHHTKPVLTLGASLTY